MDLQLEELVLIHKLLEVKWSNYMKLTSPSKTTLVKMRIISTLDENIVCELNQRGRYTSSLIVQPLKW